MIPPPGRPRSCVALAALALAVVLAPSAAAHADLVSSEPRAGGVLAEPPERVVVVWDDPVDPDYSGLRVENDQGVRIDKGDSTVAADGLTAAVSLPYLPHGIYYARWTALSLSDGHTTRGVVPFVVGDASLAAGLTEGASQEVDTGGPREALARALGFLGLSAAVGSLAFARFVLPWTDAKERGARFAHVAAATGGALVAASALALLAEAALRSLGAFEPAAVADFVARSRSGQLLAVRFLAGAVFAGLALGRAPDKALAAPALVALLTVSLGSHSAAVGPWLVANDLVHLAATAAWVGGLGLLAASALAGLAPAGRLIRAFTPVATVAVVTLVATGTVAALALADLAALPTTEYGRELLLKVGLVAVTLALGAFNGFVLGPRALSAPGERVDRVFRATVGGEFALGLAVLVVAGFLTNASPGGDAALDLPVGPQGARFAADVDNLTLELVVAPEPIVPGAHRFDVLVRKPAGGDHSILNVTMEVSKPADRSLGEAVVELDLVSHGEQYGTDGAFFTEAGDWRVEVKVRRANAYDQRVVFTVPVQERTA